MPKDEDQPSRPPSLNGIAIPPKNPKPLSKTELAAHEAQRDLAADLLQSVKEMKAGKVAVVTVPVVASINPKAAPAATRK